VPHRRRMRSLHLECPNCGETIFVEDQECGSCFQSLQEVDLEYEKAQIKSRKLLFSLLCYFFGFVGLLFQIIGLIFITGNDFNQAILLIVIGLVLFGIGIGFIAPYKGKNRGWAFLFGFLGCFLGVLGLRVVSLIPNENTHRLQRIRNILQSR
jgi:cytochrome bd-type quinol oxidase subunit 2